ncbi:MAG TPA: formate dehydrogenase accessory sulfurtransferase FdhD [Aquabacterium sp.]|uniref:formate dehydrogenase accessory sulfurtransferase FdhD n=1 Tax=Aquabacterium sp. TaxID=1872578 RepID=UPI002E3152CB|nr:formate dehydrogenase accessory sulfurtransferase FdhD [Aquabacterium sp.]HEX5357070.1 formate dehydrogenase accessory sulfurtransferase FdhD [Aquabacterium sp.]
MNGHATRSAQVLRHRADQTDWATDEVICERPVAMVFNGISHAVMMATPTELEDFGLGFALSEGLIATPADCHDIELHDSDMGTEVRMQISQRAFAALQAHRRTLSGRTGCGLCGLDSLQTLQGQLPEPISRSGRPANPSADLILQAMGALQARQALQTDTGGCHAAAWADLKGEVQLVCEDVGRHNALDKLIGKLARSPWAPDQGFVVITSRASHELVSKCARIGIGTLAAISAPTSMAIDLAFSTGLALYGFCRGDQAVHYTARLKTDC